MSCALCLKTQGPPGGDHGHRVAALGNRWGMAGRRGLVGQEQGTRAAIQGEHHEDRAANHGVVFRLMRRLWHFNSAFTVNV